MPDETITPQDLFIYMTRALELLDEAKAPDNFEMVLGFLGVAIVELHKMQQERGDATALIQWATTVLEPYTTMITMAQTDTMTRH